MNTLQDRLKQFITSLDLSVLAFENECGMAQGTVNKMTDNSRQRTLEKIRKHYPQLNMEWLKTGDGEMLNRHSAPIQHVHVQQNNNRNSTAYGYVNIAVPEKGKHKILNSDGMVIESEDATNEQLSHYKTMIEVKDEQISRLLAMIEEKDKTIARLLDKIGSVI